MGWKLTDEEAGDAWGMLQAEAQAKKLVEWLDGVLEPEHWYGGGWDGLIDKGVTHYFIDAEKWQEVCRQVGL